MKRRFFLVTLLSVFSIMMLVTPTVAAIRVSTGPSIVQTTNGAVQGIVSSSERQFLGIPFAAPPVGNLRWKPPQPAASWSGVRQATAFGPACFQPSVSQLLSTTIGGVKSAVSEDCLYLNVYTPNPAPVGSNLPVMVWIYGGAFIIGAGSYNPSPIVQEGHAIVVTFNYRLGPFGFLALPGLSAENNGSSGNYGLEDQQAALRWVKANIANFGGNPDNVTIFGESAGGSSVCDQIASPLAAGLFQRAITESGPCEGEAAFTTPTLATAQQIGTNFAANLGCTGSASAVVACMRAASASKVLNASLSNLSGFFGGGAAIGFTPDIDGTILPQSVKSAIASGAYNHVPVLAGTNRNEGALFTLLELFRGGFPKFLTASEYATILQNTFGANAVAVEAQYPVTPSTSADQAFTNMFTDYAFACPAHTADELLAAGTPVYTYEFNDPNPILIGALLPADFKLGDFHGSELFYVFGGALNIFGGLAVDFSGVSRLPWQLTISHAALSKQIIAYWTNFAATGNPNGAGLPHWPAYSPATDQFQSLTSKGSGPITMFASEHQCGFWATLGV